ncbi:hypothetical protein Nepgr_018994 [Nepenthes gracilis]|uniref:Uncharacterized protein n=1 Tax=Nepenthes gracilis TaxID=150966 RepID=A0AAD3ST63_NEPGR|nr:hypothetical protein Nepgr_018994 [Nepenthes gracilis]
MQTAVSKGKYSSDDEDLDDHPDDDQYETELSFIDAWELFKTKHNGFFVNWVKLESIVLLLQVLGLYCVLPAGSRISLGFGKWDSLHLEFVVYHILVPNCTIVYLTSLPVGGFAVLCLRSDALGSNLRRELFYLFPGFSTYYQKTAADGKPAFSAVRLRVSNGDASSSVVEEKNIDKQKTWYITS